MAMQCCRLSQEGSVLVSAVEPHDYTKRLALMEESKSLPWAAVLDYYCDSRKVPIGSNWLSAIRKYETELQGRHG
jgi:L-rhamnose isomerase